MSNEFTIVIIGLYTLVYVIVFIIQKAKMDKQDAIINSMQAFMGIFNVDEVKKYVELKEERMNMSFNKIMEDDEKFEQITKNIVNKKAGEIEDFYAKEFNEKYGELLAFSIMAAEKQDKNIQEKFISEFLPKNKDIIKKFLKND